MSITSITSTNGVVLMSVFNCCLIVRDGVLDVDGHDKTLRVLTARGLLTSW